ncbi:MAG: exonuclease domain-containing protein [Candidatus Sericytochromatia bacterium]
MSRSAASSLLRLVASGETFHIIDTETTGLSPASCRVIELATVSLRHGQIVGSFETLINPGVSIPANITKLTGISQRMLTKAPPPDEAFRQWQAYLAGQGQFVAHNANFDWGFLTAEFDRAGLDWPFRDRYCTVQLSRQCLPNLGRHSLENLIRHFGIRVTDRHRALADVEATAQIFCRFIEQLGGAPAALPQPSETPADAWEQLLVYIRERSVTTAALLDQHAELGAISEGGELILKLTPVYRDRLARERAKRALIEEGIRAIYGMQVQLRLEAR